MSHRLSLIDSRPSPDRAFSTRALARTVLATRSGALADLSRDLYRLDCICKRRRGCLSRVNYRNNSLDSPDHQLNILAFKKRLSPVSFDEVHEASSRRQGRGVAKREDFQLRESIDRLLWASRMKIGWKLRFR